MKKILIFIDWYLPGYKAGGPIRSVANIVNALKDEFDFSIITSDHDHGMMEKHKGVETNSWTRIEGVRVYYIDSHSVSKRTLLALILEEEFDVIYFNTTFSFYFTILPLWLVKRHKLDAEILVAPRGTFGESALSSKKLKKFIFLLISKLFGLYKQVTWHATTHLEEKEIKSVFGKNARIKVANNMPFIPKSDNILKPYKMSGECCFFSLSRIVAIKNLLATINLFKDYIFSGKIIFDIYGPIDEKSYWNQCLVAIKKLKGKISINYKGALPYKQLSNTLSNYHFMILLTQSENYGHAIIESMAHGSPVIISNNTPWKGLEAQKIGWDISLRDKQRINNVIQRCIDMPNDEFLIWSNNAIKYVRQTMENSHVIDQNKRLFL